MGNLPEDVSITVVWDEDDRTILDRVTAGHGRAITGAMILVVALAVLLNAGGGHKPKVPLVNVNAEVTDGGAPNGYPLHCITISASGGYSRASLDNAPACGPDGSYSTAIFRRAADGQWVALRQ